MKKFIAVCVAVILFIPTITFAAAVIAKPSSQTFKVNGETVPILSYNIAGQNYSRMRDIASALDFYIEYINAANTVQIDLTKPYEGAAITLNHIEQAEAKPSGQLFTLDGSAISFTAYNIAGQNYVRIRDIAEAVNIYVAFDQPTNCVLFDKTRNYDGSSKTALRQTHGQTVADGSGSISDTALTYKLVDGKDLSREDFSQQANPAIFNDRWTRGMYNALRQTFLDRDGIIPQNNSNRFNPYYSYASAVAKDYESRQTFMSVMSDISRAYWYRFEVEPYTEGYYLYPDYFVVSVGETNYSLDQATLDTLDAAKALSDREKILLFNQFVSSRLIYDAKSAAGIQTVFTSSEPVKGACGTYAYAFQYLCERAGIPCVSVSGENHAWTMTYIEGRWLHCDPTNSKRTDDGLFLETVRFKPDDPLRLEFAKELIVPGSTI